ncbi:hypothetical protein CLU79DRAFT_805673 [Phycomyces nitens]|nr:hypothetical protein CLU79DRAFT_805673 [Phycomyces nitens]
MPVKYCLLNCFRKWYLTCQPWFIYTYTYIVQKFKTTKSEPIPVDYPKPFETHQPTPDEKYIAYLPHSGFHNQRIELENALLLAAYLNRTLLLPPVFLGNPAMPWLRFEKLYERLLLQTKRGLEHCIDLKDDDPFPSECLNYFTWTSVPWSFFYDMKEIERYVRIVYRDDLSLDWVHSTLNVTSEDVHIIKDTSAYEFRVFDDPTSVTGLAKYVHRIDVSDLLAIEQPVLHFSSVFGTYRVLAQTPEHAELLRHFRTHMIFRNPVLVDTTKRIVDRLGGIEEYVGLHIRVGDGLFKVRATINIDNIFHQLADEFTDLDLEQVKGFDPQHDRDRIENTEYEVKQLREFQTIADKPKPIAVSHPPGIEQRLGNRPAGLQSQLRCGESNEVTKHFCKTVVYIATDCPNPRKHPLLQKIFKLFPCTFVLDDFADELEDLRRVEVVEEKVRLESYLIPMVDAMISAQGHTFIGTSDSTFTSYIERQLHPVYRHKEVKLMKGSKPAQSAI